jgi:hypothetical protein
MQCQEAEISSLIEALRRSGDLTQIDLAKRLWRCQQGRKDRRRGISASWPRLCRRPACASCRKFLAQGWRDWAAAQMANADNGSCYLVTIMVARSEALEVLPECVYGLRTALRNLRDRKARQDSCWGRVGLVGQVEIDALGVEDIYLLPPQRRMVIEALPVLGRSDPSSRDVWIPHLHIGCHAPGLDMADLELALERQWPGAGRVDVRCFQDRSAGENAGRIIGYASKHMMRLALKDGFYDAWPYSVQARYWGWLHSLRQGLKPLRMKIGPTKAKKQIGGIM